MKNFCDKYLFWLGLLLLLLAVILATHEWLMGGLGTVAGWSVSNCLAAACALFGLIGFFGGKDPGEQALLNRTDSG